MCNLPEVSSITKIFRYTVSDYGHLNTIDGIQKVKITQAHKWGENLSFRIKVHDCAIFYGSELIILDFYIEWCFYIIENYIGIVLHRYEM